MHLILSFILGLTSLSLVECLYQDQVGKFDWHKKFIGIPKFVYHHPTLDNLIIGTESNVIASLHKLDGSIIWRQLLPKECTLDHLSILKSSEVHSDYLIRTSCTSQNGNQSHFWNPQNGLLSSEARYKEISTDDEAESVLSIQSHKVDASKAFTIDEDMTLLVSEDGKLTFRVRDKSIWSREESLAAITAAEIVKLPLDLRDRFGLKKIIILVTKGGKMFGLDTITGNTVWELFDEEFSTMTHELTLLVLAKQSDNQVEEARAFVIHQNGYILNINPLTGQIIERKILSTPLRQVVQTEISDQNERGIIMLDIKETVHVYPDVMKNFVRENMYKYFLTIVDHSSSTLQGYKLVEENSSIRTKIIWTFPFNSTETIVDMKIKRFDEEVHSPARVLGDRGILYKYINPNLLAVMTQGKLDDSCNPEYYTNIYLVDGVTGALVHSAHHPKSRGPSKMVHSENWLVYSYYNMKSRRTEVSSLEMFEGTVQTNSSTFSSLTRSAIQPKLIEHKSFIFPAGIEAMVDTVTLRGMTNKHLIVALPSGALLEIPKIFLDPRRPINMLIEHREEGLIPYMPELPIPSESIINYNRTLMAVREITTSPAMLESTSLVFAYGLDLYFTRVTPSKTFDILKDDFDHVLITGVLIFLVVASYVSKLLAQRKALHAAWK